MTIRQLTTSTREQLKYGKVCEILAYILKLELAQGWVMECKMMKTSEEMLNLSMKLTKNYMQVQFSKAIGYRLYVQLTGSFIAFIDTCRGKCRAVFQVNSRGRQRCEKVVIGIQLLQEKAISNPIRKRLQAVAEQEHITSRYLKKSVTTSTYWQ